jgi:hypothetical protein
MYAPPPSLPPSQEQHLDLLAECASSGLAATCSLGCSLDGRSLDMVTVGDGPLNVWAIARQVCEQGRGEGGGGGGYPPCPSPGPPLSPATIPDH